MSRTVLEMIHINLLGLFFVIALVAAKTGPIHDKIVACFYDVQFSDTSPYTIEHIDVNLCTHLTYAFVGLDIAKNSLKSINPRDLKNNGDLGGYERMTDLKKIYPHIKVTLALSVMMHELKPFSSLISNESRRKEFAINAINYLQKYNFDGLDIFWNLLDSSDKSNFVTFMKILHKEFKKNNLILTISIPIFKSGKNEDFSIKDLISFVDFFHILSYEYDTTWKKVVPIAPLNQGKELSVKFAVEYMQNLGCPPSKIVVGIPMYGKTFLTAKTGNFGDESRVGFEGHFTKKKGYIAFNELCQLLSNKSLGWTKRFDNNTSQAIARQRVGNTTKVITYDSTRSVANKVQFAVQKNVAGVMIWSIGGDDFLGECDYDADTFSIFDKENGVKLTIPRRIYSNYPLLRTIHEAIILATDEMRILKSVCLPLLS